MKILRILILAILAICFACLPLLLTGCTHTRVFSPTGVEVIRTSANATPISYVATGASGFAFHGNLDHSTPALARGKAVGDRLSGVAGIVTALGAAALIP